MRRYMIPAAVAVAALLAAPAAGQAADGGEIAAFADEVSKSWVPHQNPNGTFIDPILGRGSAYGTTMLGYGLLRAGVRHHDPELIRAGIRAFNSRVKTTSQIRSYFQILPFAKAYVFAKRELADNPLWRQSRASWERYLRTFARGPSAGLAGGCIASPTCYHNHEAVQTAAEVALLKTGLRSRDRRSPLRRRKALERRILRDVNRVVPRFVGRSGILTGARSLRGIGLLSDTGSWPLAYHGLSTAMYAISLQALPARKTRRGRIALRRAARASLGLMAPDGDVSWLGRRQQEAWALASEISVGMTGARVAQITSGERDALRTMSRTGFARLGTRHPITATGLANTPRSFTDPAYDFSRGIQADPINSNGLAVFLLNLAADRAGTYDTTSIPMDHDGRMIVRDQSGFAAVRHGSVWYGLRRLGPRTDLRYDFGLLALKLRDGEIWRDLIEPRPVTGTGSKTGRRTTVGPVIVRAGRRYRPYGLRFKPRGGGAMTVVTSFRAGRKRFTVPVTYTPTTDGIVVGLTTRSSDAVEFLSYHPTRELQLFADGVGDAEARVTVPGLVGVTRGEGFISCCEPQLTAVTLRV
ncbi:MAG: hypothetical protein M3401_00530, partial [Actinomycetota bacterium]|nr:hypothetical protein [Actinomycetota bacterium]